MRVECMVSVAEGEATGDEVNGIADKECLLNGANCWIPVNLSKLSHDEVSVTEHVDDQAQKNDFIAQFIKKVQWEKCCHNLSMVKVALKSHTRFEGKVKVADDELDFVLHALHNFKHFSSWTLLTIRVVFIWAPVWSSAYFLQKLRECKTMAGLWTYHGWEIRLGTWARFAVAW